MRNRNFDEGYDRSGYEREGRYDAGDVRNMSGRGTWDDRDRDRGEWSRREGWGENRMRDYDQGYSGRERHSVGWGGNRDYGREYGSEGRDWRSSEFGRDMGREMRDYRGGRDERRYYGAEQGREHGRDWGRDQGRFGAEHGQDYGREMRDRGYDMGRHDMGGYDRTIGREQGRDWGRDWGRESERRDWPRYGAGYGAGSMESERWSEYGAGMGMLGGGARDRDRERGWQSREHEEHEEEEPWYKRLLKGPKGWRRSDDRIREDICERIVRAGVDASDVELQVQNGDVTFTGSVVRRDWKRRIEDLAEGVMGVRDVNNQIRYRPQQEGGAVAVQQTQLGGTGGDNRRNQPQNQTHRS